MQVDICTSVCYQTHAYINTTKKILGEHKPEGDKDSAKQGHSREALSTEHNRTPFSLEIRTISTIKENNFKLMNFATLVTLRELSQPYLIKNSFESAVVFHLYL